MNTLEHFLCFRSFIITWQHPHIWIEHRWVSMSRRGIKLNRPFIMLSSDEYLELMEKSRVILLDAASDAILAPPSTGCVTLPFDDDIFDKIHGQCSQQSSTVVSTTEVSTGDTQPSNDVDFFDIITGDCAQQSTVVPAKRARIGDD